MNFPRPCTPIKYDGTKELLMMNIQTIIIPAEFDLNDLDSDDKIGLQPNKRPISTIDKNIKRKNEHLPYKKPTSITGKYKFIEKLTKTTK